MYILVGGWATHSEKYEFVSWDEHSQYMESHKSHVPNHQSDHLLEQTLLRIPSRSYMERCLERSIPGIRYIQPKNQLNHVESQILLMNSQNSHLNHLKSPRFWKIFHPNLCSQLYVAPLVHRPQYLGWHDPATIIQAFCPPGTQIWLAGRISWQNKHIKHK